MAHSTHPTKNSSVQLYLVTALSLVGAGLSAYLSSHYYMIRNGAAGFRSYCNLGSAMNCDVVAASPYAELVAGIPLSSFAAGWFLGLAIVAILALNKEWRRDAIRIAFGMSLFATALSVLYFLIMAMVLKTYCLFCLIIDGVNIVNLGLLATMKPESFKKHRADPSQSKTLIGTVLAALFVAVVGLKGLDEMSLDRATQQEMVSSVLATSPVPVNAGPEYPSIGPKDAPITIVEFSDFQCPYCRIGAFSLNTVLNRYPTQVRVVFRNYPLDPACNKAMQHAGHPFACEAARVALCANQQGKFQPFYETVFENQANLKTGKVLEFAKEVGLDPAQITACSNSTDVQMAVAKDIEEGDRLGIKSTPTFFVNGRKVEGVMPAPVWSKIIDQLLIEKK